MERSESQLSWCAKESIDWLERGAQELGRPLLLCQQYRPGAVDAIEAERERIPVPGLELSGLTRQRRYHVESSAW